MAERILQEEQFPIDGRREPDVIKVTREPLLQAQIMEDSFFAELEKRQSLGEIQESISTKVNPTTFKRFVNAIGEILYIQSYQSGNEDINSGLSRMIDYEEKDADDRGGTHFKGDVRVTLQELCRKAFGRKPDKYMRGEMTTLINQLHHIPAKITYNGGKRRREIYLCLKQEVDVDVAKGESTEYHLHLHPIFCDGIKTAFAKKPRNSIQMLRPVFKTLTPALLNLYDRMFLFLNQKEHSLKLDALLDVMGLKERYAERPGRTEREITKYCDGLVKVGIIKGYKCEYTEKKRGKNITKKLSKVTFYPNKKFVKSGTIEETFGQGTESEPQE